MMERFFSNVVNTKHTVVGSVSLIIQLSRISSDACHYNSSHTADQNQ